MSGCRSYVPDHAEPSMARSRKSWRREPAATGIYQTFTEGFATPDLLEASDLLSGSP